MTEYQPVSHRGTLPETQRVQHRQQPWTPWGKPTHTSSELALRVTTPFSGRRAYGSHSCHRNGYREGAMGVIPYLRISATQVLRLALSALHRWRSLRASLTATAMSALVCTGTTVSGQSSSNAGGGPMNSVLPQAVSDSIRHRGTSPIRIIPQGLIENSTRLYLLSDNDGSEFVALGQRSGISRPRITQ